MPKELDEQFQFTVTKDELTVILLGLGAAAGLFNGQIQETMMQMVATYIPLRIHAGRSFEPDLVSVLEKCQKLAYFYGEEKRNASAGKSNPGSSGGHDDRDASGAGT